MIDPCSLDEAGAALSGVLSNRIVMIVFQQPGIHRRRLLWRYPRPLCLTIALITTFLTSNASAHWDAAVIIDAHFRQVKGAPANEESSTRFFLDGTALELGYMGDSGLGVLSSVVLEPVHEATAGEDSIFDDHGVFIQELKVVYQTEYYSAYIGKLNLNFGRAWNFIPGIFRKTLTSEYEFTERLGVGGSIDFMDFEEFDVTVGGTLFRADTTVLSSSIFVDRGRRSRTDGGLSNTSGLGSYMVHLDIVSSGDTPTFDLHVASSVLKPGIDQTSNQKGTVASLSFIPDFLIDIDTEVLIELADFADWSGQEDVSNTFYTGALVVTGQRNSVQLVYSAQNHSGSSRQSMFEVSGGRRFSDRLTAYLGFMNRPSDSGQEWEIGARIVYEFDLWQRQ